MDIFSVMAPLRREPGRFLSVLEPDLLLRPSVQSLPVPRVRRLPVARARRSNTPQATLEVFLRIASRTQPAVECAMMFVLCSFFARPEAGGRVRPEQEKASILGNDRKSAYNPVFFPVQSSRGCPEGPSCTLLAGSLGFSLQP